MDISNTYYSSVYSKKTRIENESNVNNLTSNNNEHNDVTRRQDDVVEISDAAKQASLRSNQHVKSDQFRVREGFANINLVNAVKDPNAQPFSQNRPFSEVAAAARTSMDEIKQLMFDSGRPLGVEGSGQDYNTMMGELDRRALFAVASNEGELFTEKERTFARDIMRKQQGAAMFTLGSATDRIDVARNGSDFMDRVSAEEKAFDFEWASQRATLQAIYEEQAEKQGIVPEESDLGHPLAKLLLEAMKSYGESNEIKMHNSSVESAEDIANLPWMKGYESRLMDAISQTREQFGFL